MVLGQTDSMNVSLTHELEQFVRNKVSGGLFQNASEVVRSALREMKSAEDSVEKQQAWLRSAIEQGLNEAQAGKLVSSSDAKSKQAKFKDEWKKSRTMNA